jgi:hypothetical protein
MFHRRKLSEVNQQHPENRTNEKIVQCLDRDAHILKELESLKQFVLRRRSVRDRLNIPKTSNRTNHHPKPEPLHLVRLNQPEEIGDAW